MDAALLTQLISARGPTGFVMWLVWRTTNHTIPRLAKAFEDASDRQRQDFREMLQQQRSDFERILDREQLLHKEQTDKLLTGMREFAESLKEDRRAMADLRSV